VWSAECSEAFDLFTTNTEDGTLARVADWRLYCIVVYGKVIPEVADIKWPPTEPEWKQFILAARPKVSSMKRLEHVVGSVCWVASRHMSRKLGSLPEVHLWDPRKMYQLEHRRTMGLIRREHGVGVQQLEAITMAELKNATRFADRDSVQGMAECAAFTLAALLGGKRARSLTAVRLRDVKLFASHAIVDEQAVLVPALEITFTDEKFADLRGPRKARDVPHTEDYARKKCTVVPSGSIDCWQPEVYFSIRILSCMPNLIRSWSLDQSVRTFSSFVQSLSTTGLTQHQCMSTP